MKSMVRAAWTESRREQMMTESLVLVSNVPQVLLTLFSLSLAPLLTPLLIFSPPPPHFPSLRSVFFLCLRLLSSHPKMKVPEANRDEFCKFLLTLTNSYSTAVGEIYLEIDEVKKKTKPWYIVELVQARDLSKLRDGLSKHKRKIPLHLGATTLHKKDKPYQLTTFPDFVFNESKSNDERLVSYLKSLLYDAQSLSLTPGAAAAVKTMFLLYADGEDGILDAKRMDLLQMMTNNEPFGTENSQHLFDTYESKTIDGVQGLTLNGLIQVYTEQANGEPLETWNELFQFGFDLRFRLGSYSQLDHAIDSYCRPLPRAVDAQIVHYAESKYVDLHEIDSPVRFSSCRLPPLSDADKQHYPLIASLELRQLRLRFSTSRSFLFFSSPSLCRLSLALPPTLPPTLPLSLSPTPPLTPSQLSCDV